MNTAIAVAAVHGWQRWRYWLLVGLTIVLAIVLSACQSNLKSQPARVPQLVVSTVADPKTFNYALNNSAQSIFPFTFDGLVDEHGITAAIVPALAESWQISDDKKHIIFTLRDGLKWSDGHPLTADDVVFSYKDVYLNETIPTDARDSFRIGDKKLLPNVKKLDDRRVEFILPEPSSPFLRATTAKILPAHSLRQSVFTKGSDGNPQFLSTWGTDTNPAEIITNGPYLIESYSTNQRVIYRRNPYYWRKGTQGESLPYIDRIIWQVVENSDGRMLRFRSGDLDIAGLRPEDFSLLKREEQRGKFAILNGGAASGTTFIAFNLNRASNASGKPFVDPIKARWFNTKAFRQAVAYALDRQSIINNLFRGVGELQNSPISVQSPYFLSPQQGLKVYEYDPAKAKALLLEAGFKYDAEQLLDSAGNRVRFAMTLPAGSRTAQQLAAQMQQDLRYIGIQLDLNPVDFNVLVERVGSRNWECYFLSYTGGVEPNDGANYWASVGTSHDFNQGPKAGSPPLKNWVVSDWEQDIDRLYVAGAREYDENKRKQIYAEFQRIVQEQVPVIHLVTPTALSAIRDRVKGVQFSGLDTRGSLWNVYELKVTDN